MNFSELNLDDPFDNTRSDIMVLYNKEIDSLGLGYVEDMAFWCWWVTYDKFGGPFGDQRIVQVYKTKQDMLLDWTIICPL